MWVWVQVECCCSFSRSICPCLHNQFSSYIRPNLVFTFIWNLSWWLKPSQKYTFYRPLKYRSVTSENFGLDWASLMPCPAATPCSPAHGFLIDIHFFCQMTLFNGLRRFPYVDLTSVSLMIPCFDLVPVPQCPYSTTTPHFQISQSFWHLDAVVTPAPFLTSAAPTYSVSFTVLRAMCVSSPHIDCKLLKETISLLPFYVLRQPNTWLETQWAFIAGWKVRKCSGKRLS